MKVSGFSVQPSRQLEKFICLRRVASQIDKENLKKRIKDIESSSGGL